MSNTSSQTKPNQIKPKSKSPSHDLGCASIYLLAARPTATNANGSDHEESIRRAEHNNNKKNNKQQKQKPSA